MKYLIQLQDCDKEKYRSLYIDIQEIAAITPLVHCTRQVFVDGKLDREKSDYEVLGTTIHMLSGKCWNVHNYLPEVLAKIEEYNEYMKGQPK